MLEILFYLVSILLFLLLIDYIDARIIRKTRVPFLDSVKTSWKLISDNFDIIFIEVGIFCAVMMALSPFLFFMMLAGTIGDTGATLESATIVIASIISCVVFIEQFFRNRIYYKVVASYYCLEHKEILRKVRIKKIVLSLIIPIIFFIFFMLPKDIVSMTFMMFVVGFCTLVPVIAQCMIFIYIIKDVEKINVTN